jgi:hypothetical protein
MYLLASSFPFLIYIHFDSKVFLHTFAAAKCKNTIQSFIFPFLGLMDGGPSFGLAIPGIFVGSVLHPTKEKKKRVDGKKDRIVSAWLSKSIPFLSV